MQGARGEIDPLLPQLAAAAVAANLLKPRFKRHKLYPTCLPTISP